MSLYTFTTWIEILKDSDSKRYHFQKKKGEYQENNLDLKTQLLINFY